MDITERGNSCNTILGSILHRAITAQGFNLSSVARELSTHQVKISQYVHGKRPIPINMFVAICETIEVSPARLLDLAYRQMIAKEGIYQTDDSLTEDYYYSPYAHGNERDNYKQR